MIKSEIRSILVADLAAYLATNYPGFDVFYENGPQVDLQTQPRPFVHLEVAWNNSLQMALGPDAPVAVVGDLVLAAFVKEGSGTAVLEGLTDAVEHDYRMRTLSGIRLQVGRPYKAKSVAGWYANALRLPFEVDDV